MSGACQFCNQKTLIPYEEAGKKVCSSCDRVQDFDDFQTYFGGITGETGTYVYVGSSGTGNIPTFKEKKLYEAHKLIEDFVYKLNLSHEKFDEIKGLIHKITEGEYGMGNWFPVLIGACIYVVMRKDGKLILPLSQVADLVGCDVYELGSMVTRVVHFVDMKLPVFDIVTALKHAVMESQSFRVVEEDLRRTMVQQGVFLVQCLIKWCVSTGRRPMPVVVAVMVFVAEVNQVAVKIGEVAKEMNVAVSTCKKRYKELLDSLVKVAAKVLPWGKDVTVKNIMGNAPFVIQYMEVKAMKKSDGKRKGSGLEIVNYDIDGLVDECLSRRIGYSYDGLSTEEDKESQYFEIGHTLTNLIEAYANKSPISAESLAVTYSNYLDDISIVKENAEGSHKRKGRERFDLDDDRDWWKGNSDMSVKLLPDQIPEKDVGWDDAPPSYHKGCTREAQRRERIKAAKLRIQNIMQPADNNTESGLSNELCLFDTEKSKKRKKMKLNIDSEDLVIETLLLHNVKEEEIEKGYYNALLDLHVFNGTEIE